MTYYYGITTQISETFQKQVLYKDVWYLKPNDFRYANNVLFEKIKVYIEGVVAHLQSFEDREFCSLCFSKIELCIEIKRFLKRFLKYNPDAFRCSKLLWILLGLTQG